jgi:hypothetical protein
MTGMMGRVGWGWGVGCSKGLWEGLLEVEGKRKRKWNFRVENEE